MAPNPRQNSRCTDTCLNYVGSFFNDDSDMIRGSSASLILPIMYHSNPWTEMENSGFETDRSVEMTGVKTISDKITETQTHQEHTADPPKPRNCNMAACRQLHEQYLKDKSKMTNSPWHYLKTVFLVGIIMLLVIWVLVYTVFTWLDLV